MIIRSRRTIGAIALVGALALAACGADKPPQSTGEPTVTNTSEPDTSSSPTGPAPAPTVSDTTDADDAVTAETATTASASTVTSIPASSGDCRRLTDFDDPDAHRANWVIVNDGVMGGRSSGFVDFADSSMRFSGDVVTAGGGFTSVRLRTIGDELVGTDRIVLRLRHDGRTYSVTFNDAPGTRQRIAHGADIIIDGPSDEDGWSTVEVRYDDLRPTVFGQPVDAPAFDPQQVSEIGIIISDGVDGAFMLEVDWIDAC